MQYLITPDGNHLVAACDTCHVYTLLRGLIAQLEKEAVIEEENYLNSLGRGTEAAYKTNPEAELTEGEASRLRNMTLVELTENLCRKRLSYRIQML